MKWKTNTYKPQKGDTRIVRKFAWLPKKCEGGYTVWLETYDSHQTYQWGQFTLEWVEDKRHYLTVYL